MSVAKRLDRSHEHCYNISVIRTMRGIVSDKMASLFDTVSKEVVSSDGDDHQLQGELSHQLLMPENSRRNLIHSGRLEHERTHYPDLNLYKRILTDNNSVSGHSDIESSAEPEYYVTPAIWLENEERGTSTER